MIWTEKHQAESKFLKSKVKAKKQNAAADGLLRPGEDPGRVLRRGGFTARQKLAKSAARRLRTRNPMQSGGPADVRKLIRGKKCIILAKSPPAHIQITACRLIETRSLAEASVFVVDRPTVFKPNSDATWAAALKGGFLISSGSVGGDAKPYLKLRCALENVRVIHVSVSFIARHRQKLLTRWPEDVLLCSMPTQLALAGAAMIGSGAIAQKTVCQTDMQPRPSEDQCCLRCLDLLRPWVAYHRQAEVRLAQDVRAQVHRRHRTSTPLAVCGAGPVRGLLDQNWQMVSAQQEFAGRFPIVPPAPPTTIHPTKR